MSQKSWRKTTLIAWRLITDQSRQIHKLQNVRKAPITINWSLRNVPFSGSMTYNWAYGVLWSSFCCSNFSCFWFVRYYVLASILYWWQQIKKVFAPMFLLFLVNSAVTSCICHYFDILFVFWRIKDHQKYFLICPPPLFFVVNCHLPTNLHLRRPEIIINKALFLYAFISNSEHLATAGKKSIYICQRVPRLQVLVCTVKKKEDFW